MKRTGLTRRTPLRSQSRLSSSARLRSRPSKRARPGEPLATWCEAAVADVCAGRAVHRHHRVLRSQGGGDDLTLDVCVACHRHIHAHPATSYERGWLLHPWDVDKEDRA